MKLLKYKDIWTALLHIATRRGNARAQMALDDLIALAAFDDEGAWLPNHMVRYR